MVGPRARRDPGLSSPVDVDDACTGGDVVTDVDYLYDPAGQLRGQGDGCAFDTNGAPNASCDVEVFTYDGAGNRTVHTRAGATMTYTTNEANQITQAATAGGNTTTYAYNWAGDRTQAQTTNAQQVVVDTIDYTWGPDGYVDQTTGDNWFFGETARHQTRNAFGALIGQDHDAGNDGTAETTADIVWDPTREVPQIADVIVNDAQNTDTHNIQAYGLRRLYDTGVGAYFVYDWTDSAIETTDFVDYPTDYSSFGQPIGVGSFAPFFGYHGELTGIGAGLHLRNRDYDTSTGTFLSRDPLDGIDGTPTPRQQLPLHRQRPPQQDRPPRPTTF